MRLKASLDFGDGLPNVQAGEIAWSAREKQAYIEWDDEIRDLNLNISPFLVRDWSQLHTTRNRAAFYGLPAVVGDSVPDGWGRLLMDRDLMRRAENAPRSMAYLAMVGKHGMGAMCYEPADESAARIQDLSLDYFASSADRIEEVDYDVLAGIRAISGGSQGARPKFVALKENETGKYRDIRSGWNPGWSHVLVKRAAGTDLPSAVAIEAAYATAARQAGIGMSNTSVVRAKNRERFFETERFDRDGAQRFHMQSAAALLDNDYQSGTLTYENLFQISEQLHGDDRDSEQLLRRLAFNVATVNQDDHSKNHAYLMRRDGSWELAPAFDVTYAPKDYGYHELGLSSAEMNMKPSAILDLAGKYGVDRPRAKSIVGEVHEVVQTLPSILKDHAILPKTADAIGKKTRKASRQLPITRAGDQETL